VTGTEAVRRRLPRTLRRALDEAAGHDLLLLSAALAFYALVSIVPLVIVAMWLTGLVVGEGRVHLAAESLAAVLPRGIGVDRALILVAGQGTALGVGAAITALWPASAYGAGLRRCFANLSPRTRQSYEGFRGRGLALLFLLPVMTIGALLGAFAGTALFGDGVTTVVGWILAPVLAFAASAVGLAAIYRFFPRERLGWRSIVRAVVTAGVGIAVLSFALAQGLGVGADFREHYALSSLAGIVLLASWLFAANALVLLGYLVAVTDTASRSPTRRRASRRKRG
jgi:membrane protein